MAIYELSAKEVIYLSFEVEADSPEEASNKAYEMWTQGQFMEGDTELQGLEVCGELMSGAGRNA